MATKEYEVTLRLRVDDNPAHWGWRAVLDLDPNETVDLCSCIEIHTNFTPELEEWLPETDEEDS